MKVSEKVLLSVQSMLAERARVDALLQSMPLPFELARMYAPPQGEELAQSEADVFNAPHSTIPLAEGQPLPKHIEARQHKFVVGVGHIIGFNVTIDYPFGMTCVREAAQSECVAAQATMCLDDNNVVVKDRAFSVLLAVAKSDRGYSDAMCFTCKCLCARACELGLVKMPEGYSVVAEYETAMQNGFSMGNFLCGTMYMRQHFFALAYTCFEQAAEEGVVLAHFMLAKCLSKGLGVLVDKEDAMTHARAAHMRGSRQGTFLYACLLLDKEDCKIEQQFNNEAHAATLLLKVAAEYDACLTEEKYMTCTYLRGNATCPNPHKRLYECYRDGVGVVLDSDMAALHWSKAV